MTGDRWSQLPDAGLVERAWHPVDPTERKAALHEIFRRYRDVVSTVCAYNLDDMDRVRDVAQNTFEIATKELIRGDNPREPEKLRAWLCGIARNRCHEEHRRRGNQDPTPVESLQADDEDEERLRKAEVVNRLADVVATSFTRYQRRIFQFSIRQELHGTALAAALSVSAKKAYNLAYENKGRVNEGFGALVLAREGRPYCPGLADILDRSGWDGERFTRVLRLRIIKHLGTCPTCDNCATCTKHQARLVKRYAPALIPILIAPELTEKVTEIIDQLVDDEERNRKNKSSGGAAAVGVAAADQQQNTKGGCLEGVMNFVGAIFLLILVATVGPKLFPTLFDKGGKSGTTGTSGTVALHVWTPPDLGSGTGRVQVQSQPTGMNCAMRTENDPCRASFKSGTQVTLTAVISPALTRSGRQLVWLGCGNRPTATQPCTLTLTRETSVCVAPASSQWTVEVCRQKAGG
nr:hypothetical protein [Kibdelosporangium sp. MJ126-NF4]CEL21413.1 alanine-rich protein [Kibdelosporangium sp. MJ126-NF4]CTQ96020.1 alanine-rich protein [Kibdelosporangium sp. MJ126-NF4]